MRAQIALEYIAAFLTWIIVCAVMTFMLNSYVSTLSLESEIMSYSATVQKLNEIAASDTDGMRYQYGHNRINNTISFNNSIASIHTRDRDILHPSPVSYAFSEDFHLGDTMLIKNQDGQVIIVRLGS